MSEPKKLMQFFEEKGFYIVLSLCILAIGTAAYVLFFAKTNQNPTQLEAQTTAAAAVTAAPEEVEVFSFPKSTTAASTTTRKTQQQSAKSTNTTAATTAAPAVTTAAATTAPKSAATRPAATTKAAKSDGFYIRPVSGEIYQPFSGEELVYDRTNGDWRTHNGVDFLCVDGAKVMAIADGVVADIFTDDYYGTSLLLEHADGIKSIYLGLSQSPSVMKGQEVSAGDVIGAVDTDVLFESALPVHFHLEVMQDDVRIDPMTILK